VIFSLSAFKSNIIVCFLFLSLLAACVPSVTGINTGAPEIGDGGFLSREPCGPPCFWDIIPGVTTEAEAIQILQSRGLFQKCEAFAHSGGRGITCPSGIEIVFQQEMDIVGVVGFQLSQAITIEDVIARYGEPDAVLVGVISRYPRTRMVLYYDDLKAELFLPWQEDSKFSVVASTKIEHISYNSKVSYESSRSDSFPRWNGYGEYREYVPREQ
jgi:hypothetical protein